MLIKNPTHFEGKCFAFIKKDIILKEGNDELNFNDLKVIKASMQCGDIFCEPEYNICTVLVNDGMIPEGYTTEPLRHYNNGNEEEEQTRTFRAKGLASWTANTRYCTVCGKELTTHKELTALQCSGCGKTVFPRIEPCIIVLVRRGREMLLARHVQRNQDIYACIAGFMETGEDAEHTVKREVFEETGITIKNIKYFGTQSWPFPSQLMIAFTAEWESGELKLQEDEISDAGWFTPENCPATPTPGSIAYRMINSVK